MHRPLFTPWISWRSVRLPLVETTRSFAHTKVHGRKPPNYWKEPAHRHQFLHQLARSLSLHTGEDWQRAGRQSIIQHGGRSILKYYPTWQEAVQSAFPEIEFSPSPAPLRNFLTEFAQHHDIHSPEDWKKISWPEILAFRDAQGGPSWSDHFHSVSALLRAAYPHENWSFLNRVKSRNYWRDANNIREFLEDFARCRGLTAPEDWQQVTKFEICQFGGRGIFRYYRTLQDVLEAIYPNENWNAIVPPPPKPRAYWENRERQREFIESFCAQSNRQVRPDEWKSVTVSQFREAGGRSILYHYDSLYDMMSSLYPQHDWQVIKPTAHPPGYWTSQDTQRQFLDRFARERGIRTQEDWRQVTGEMVKQAGGGGLLAYHPSLFHALQSLYPEWHWNPYEFTSLLPVHAWTDPQFQRGFLDHMARKYGIEEPSQWREITVDCIRKEGGATFLKQFPSFFAALQSCYPEADWNVTRTRKQAPRDHWKDASHCRQLLEQIAARLGVEQPEDWYRVSLKQIRAEGGSGMLKSYDFKLYPLFQFAYPDVEWDQERFVRSDKRAGQRWLFVLLQRLFPGQQIIEEFISHAPRHSGRAVELDIYLPDLSMGFEFQGQHHYHDSPKFGQLELYQQRDKEKKALCDEHNIRLVIVPYWWDTEARSLCEMIRPSLSTQELNQWEEHWRTVIQEDVSSSPQTLDKS